MFNNTEDSAFNSNSGLIDAGLNPDNEAYGLNVAQNNSDSVGYTPGTFEADTFTLNTNYDVNVFSGNGNIEYGYGFYDYIDLSHISIEQVVDHSLAQTDEGGILVDTGNGTRVFDSITLADGNQVVFEGIDAVVFADQTVDLTVNPSDTFFAEQWNLHMMGVHNAWRMTTGSDSVLIGVQDTGLAIDNYGNFHEDIDANTLMIAGNVEDEFLIEDGTASQPQSNSHGTAVQGIISANTNNGVGIAGINWESDVANIDVLHGNEGDLTTAEAAQMMIDQANSQGQNLVINMSFGNSSFGAINHPNHAEFEQIVAANPNTLFVISAGNSGNLGQEGIASPAIFAQAYDNVIAVGASWGNVSEDGLPVDIGTRADYSQYGEGLTVMGPTSVITTDAIPGLGFDYNYTFNGTSAAAPNVSGVASLVWSANSDLTAAEVKQILSETATDLGQAGYDIFYGHGFVNADAAVRRAIALGRTDNNNSIFNSSSVTALTSLVPDENVTFPKTNQAASLTPDKDVITDLEVISHFGNEITDNLFDYEAVGMAEVLDLNPQLQPELVEDLYTNLLAA